MSRLVIIILPRVLLRQRLDSLVEVVILKAALKLITVGSGAPFVMTCGILVTRMLFAVNCC